MEALTLAIAGIMAILVLGALAATFGTDSRDSVESDHRLDPQRLPAGGIR